MNRPDLDIIDGSDPIRRQAATWAARLHADDVSEADRAAWHDWMSTSERHRHAYARIESLWSSLGEFAHAREIVARIDPSPGVATAIPPGQTAGRRRRDHSQRWGVLVAAMLILVIGTAILLPVMFPPVEDIVYRTAPGERRSLLLADDSRLDLDTDSMVTVRFSEKERQILIERGRAFFRVAKGKHPFVVRSRYGSVRAVGTAFEVYDREHGFRVSLYEGRVDLLAAADSIRPDATLASLSPGQSALLRPGGLDRESDFPVAADMPPWTSGRLLFDDVPLQAAVDEFNRYSNALILIDSKSLKSLRISGRFRSEDTDGFVEALAAVYGVEERKNAAGERILTLPRPKEIKD